MEYIKHYVPDFDVGTEFTAEKVQLKLKDGVALCKLMNGIQGYIQINYIFKQMENIGNFLAAAKDYGVNGTDLFQPVCLVFFTVAVTLKLHLLPKISFC